MEAEIVFNKFLKKYFGEILILLFITFLITGPFLTDLTVSLMAILALFKIYKNKKIFYKNWLFITFIIWNIFIILISLTSNNVLLSLESSLFYFRFGLFSIFFYLVLINCSNIFHTILLITLLSILAFVAYDGIIQYIFGVDLFGIRADIGSYTRISGLFGEELIMGSFLSRTYPFVFFLFLYTKKKSSFFNYIFFLISIFVLFAVLLSGERAAIFNIILFLLITILLTKGLNQIKYLILLTSTITFVYVLLFNSDIKERLIDYTYTQIYNNEATIFSKEHTKHYSNAYLIFKENIFFGSGPKTFRVLCKNYLDLLPQSCSTHPHNTYMQLLSEIGIIGTIPILIIFLYILMLFIRQFYSILINAKFLENYKIILLSSLFISLWPIIPTGNFFSNYLSALYYLPIGYILYVFSLIKTYK